MDNQSKLTAKDCAKDKIKYRAETTDYCKADLAFSFVLIFLTTIFKTILYPIISKTRCYSSLKLYSISLAKDKDLPLLSLLNPSSSIQSILFWSRFSFGEDAGDSSDYRGGRAWIPSMRKCQYIERF